MVSYRCLEQFFWKGEAKSFTKQRITVILNVRSYKASISGYSITVFHSFSVFQLLAIKHDYLNSKLQCRYKSIARYLKLLIKWSKIEIIMPTKYFHTVNSQMIPFVFKNLQWFDMAPFFPFYWEICRARPIFFSPPNTEWLGWYLHVPSSHREQAPGASLLRHWILLSFDWLKQPRKWEKLYIIISVQCN